MKNTKECPECGTTFEGRSNKVYCSDKCKITAFRNAQSQDLEPEEEEINFLEKPKKISSKESPSDMTLQLELRKLELAHAREMAEMELREKEKERQFEMDKIRFQHENEKKELQNQISLLKHQTPQYHEEEYEQEDELEEEEVELIYLPKGMKKYHKKLVKQFLSWEDEMLTLSLIKEYQAEVVSLIDDIAEYIEDNEIDRDKVVGYKDLRKINLSLTQMKERIALKGFFEAKETSFHLSDRWRSEMEESLG